MGGDDAPLEIVRGGVEYAHETGRTVLLVGQEGPVRAAIDEIGAVQAPVEIVPASEVIAFDDKVASVRSKPDSSIRVGLQLVREGRACGFVSAGHTGAMMALSRMVLRRIAGVDRPALPAPLPKRKGGHTILLDAGANIDCNVENLVQFAVMGSDYCRAVFRVENPRVGLLSIGEEETKGSELLLRSAEILRASQLNFVGNVEGNDIFSDRADVIVCDGFVGNVALKMGEGLAEAIVGMIKDEVSRSSVLTMLGAFAMRPAFKSLKRKIDYAETGGVPFLGIGGISVVAHGRSNAKAIRSALRVAAQAHENGLVELMGREIADLAETEKRLGDA